MIDAVVKQVEAEKAKEAQDEMFRRMHAAQE
jgi:hypothetical protein